MTSQHESPSTHGTNGGRDNTGRFAPGNKLGQGNPLAGRAAKIRAALFKAVNAKDMAAIVGKLVEKAKTGDLAAIRLLLDRTLGPAVEIDILARLEALEERVAEKK